MRLAAILVLYLALAGCASRSPDSLVAACDRAADDLSNLVHSVRICTDAISSGVLTPSQEAQVLADRGRYNLGFNKLNDAIADCDRAIALKPDLAEAYFTRGLSYFYLGKYDEALDSYDQALKIDPRMVNAYNSRGHTHFTRREWDLALPEYKRAIEIDPNYAPAHQNLATTYVEMGQYQLAIEEYDRALALEPENDFARAQRALARARAGELDGALQDANEALEHTDDVNLGRIVGAKATRYTSYLARGTAYLKKKDYAAAVASFGDAIKINPKGAHAYYLRAGAYRLAGDTRKADENHKVALELDPEIETKIPWLERSS